MSGLFLGLLLVAAFVVGAAVCLWWMAWKEWP
jgi:hypothetical protein